MTSPLARHQRRLLQFAYYAFAPFAWLSPRVSWVVGVEEVALVTRHIADAIPRAYAVVQRRHPFYDVEYDAVIQSERGRLAKFRRLYGGTLLLAWLAHRARGFIYVGRAGFLDIVDDERRFEFEFLKRRGKRIVTYFTGTDIRSLRLMVRLADETGRPNIGSKLAESRPELLSDEFEAPLERRAQVADDLADAIYSMSVDQKSYLQRPTLPFRYFQPDDAFVENAQRFDDLEKVVVVHAPSNPALKGTQFVREAMARITSERPHVDYRELTGVSNAEVLAALGEAHIVLNQFYAFAPGVFGIEAMARGAAMLCSADERLEPDLATGANDAWLVTPHESIYENVNALLDDPTALRALAARGYRWARANASQSASASSLAATLGELERRPRSAVRP